MPATVVVEKLRQTNEQLVAQIYDTFNPISLLEEFDRATAVFIKPNLTYPVYKKGVTTRKEFVECLVAALRQINTRTQILIGEGEGGYNSFSMSEAMQKMGYNDLEKAYPKVNTINLSKLPTKEVKINTLKGRYSIRLPKIFFDDIDFSMTCPLPKVHCMTRITLSFKNQWGCIPDTMRLKNHYRFNFIISKIAEILKFRYAFLDGKFGLDDNGPMEGIPVETDWFVAANSLGAFDRTVSSMMGVDYKRVGHLKVAEKYGLIPSEEETKIIGNPDNLAIKFTLRRNLWNYPALAGFHSKHLTHLFYFSMWSKILHDIMYTFRKRPISGMDHWR
jgi:uncharacterized protein (DUF362 family)